MSGIVGIVRFDGSPIDERLLRRMTDSMARRGPDLQQIWLGAQAGLGHALLHTVDGSGSVADDRQPASLDGRVWITADARVDDRAELVRKLEARGRTGLERASDAQLILHAYHAWGAQCVDHLLGDFAFAIWDERARRLFCARDHFGVKPFYYAQVPGGIVFSNTLDCIRLHPAVRNELNEVAIGDFLLFGSNQDPATTAFADVRRLAPAHALSCKEGAVGLERYWAVPTGGRIRYRHSHEYVDHFRALLRTAVADRVRTKRVGVWMSGGLDSTSITAVAREVLAERHASFDLVAHTIVYDRLIPDQERYYSGLAAEALEVKTSYFVADDYRPFHGWDKPDRLTPEPIDDPFFAMRTQQLTGVAAQSRTVLSGEGGDELLWRSYVADLAGKVPMLELGASVARSLIGHRRRPAVGARAKVTKWLRREAPLVPYPGWLDGALADRMDLRVRYERVTGRTLTAAHPWRREAHRRLTAPLWSWYFESSDPGVTGVPVEACYPFLDVRLVTYALAIPPLPWFIDKHLLREAMRGYLPDQIRLRPKVPLAGDPLRAHIVEAGAAGDGPDVWQRIRPACLNYWLSRVHGYAY